MFGWSKRERRQKRYKQIRAIAKRQGRVSFDLSDFYLDQLAFDVLDQIITANFITTEQYADMGITVEDNGPAVEAAEAAAAKAEALEEYNQARQDLEQPESDYHSASTSVPEPEPVRETPAYTPPAYTPPSPSSYDDDSSRSSRSSGGFGGSSDDDSSRSSGGWSSGGSSDYGSSSSSDSSYSSSD